VAAIPADVVLTCGQRGSEWTLPCANAVSGTPTPSERFAAASPDPLTWMAVGSAGEAGLYRGIPGMGFSSVGHMGSLQTVQSRAGSAARAGAARQARAEASAMRRFQLFMCDPFREW
jgi:hypothetical protein